MTPRHLIPPTAGLTGGALAVYSIESWWRWEPAALLIALLLTTVAIIYDPEPPSGNDG